MSPEKEKIYIIGQGIAGTVLAFLLDKKGYRVQIIDDGHLSSSGMVAAGMWNPVSFVRMSQSWMADELLPAAERIYRGMEELTSSSFYHPMEYVKIFPDNRSANQWDEKSVSPELSQFLTSKQDESVKEQFKQDFGHGVLKGSGWMDIPKMLLALRDYFKSKNLLEISSFTKEDCDSILKNETDSLLIFATGWKNTELFSERVKIIPNKGETLTVRSEQLQLSRIINFGKFLIPLGDGLFRLGATYHWDYMPPGITEEDKATILEPLSNHYSGEVEVVNHTAGYRPTTKDRRPIIGIHPENHRKAFFNGFGSKGVMLIPFFAEHFIEHLETGKPLLKEVRVERFFKD